MEDYSQMQILGKTEAWLASEHVGRQSYTMHIILYLFLLGTDQLKEQ